jgi:tRNA splicing endonuclease
MKAALQSTVIEPEPLKPSLHEKIDRMDDSHLALLNRILLQLEAEEIAARLGDGFD